MLELFKNRNFLPYIIIVFLNAMSDLGHKIVLQNTIFKYYTGNELVVLTAIVNALILLPFIFLFSPAGYISDKYKKTKVIKYSSAFAIIITTLITICYYFGLFWVAFAMTFILAAQSAIYAPAKYGLIKEMFGNEKIAEANGIVQAVTIVSILAGAVIYSIFFEKMVNSTLSPNDILTQVTPLGFLLIISSIFEFILAIKLDREFIAAKFEDKIKFDVKEYGKLNYLKSNIKLLKSHKAIWLSIVGLSIFWGISQVVVAVFGDFLKSSLGITDTVIAQGLLSLSGVGIVIGSIVAGRASRNYLELGIVPLGVLGIVITLYLLPTLSSIKALAIDLITFGFFAGLFIVPLNALIQFASPKDVLGKILAGNNFMQNLFMFIFLIITAIVGYFNLPSKILFYIVTTISIFGLIFVLTQLPQALIRYFVKLFLGIKYRLSVYGLDNIDPNRGTLLLGNHISFLDWAILQMSYPKQIRFVMDRVYYEKWYLKPFLKFFKVIPISTKGSKSALKAVSEALNSGDTVALFPEGHISRNGHLSRFKRGFETALKEVNEDVMIIPFYLRGLWEDNFSYASKKLKRGGIKDISVTFGAPMSKESNASEVKKAVFELSIKSWQEYAKTLPSIQKAWLRQHKEQPLRLAVADSTGVELSSAKFISAVFLMAKRLKPLIKGKNIGIILPTSAGGYIGNMSLLTLDKTIVNLNYSAGIPSLKDALRVADIKTIVTSKLFIKKLQNKGFDLSEILDMSEVIYLEDLKKEISKLESIYTFLLVKIAPAWLLELIYIRSSHIEDSAAILFSSGSEGTPKGIELTHKNIMGNIKQFVTLVNPEDNDVVLGTLPIFHSFGLTVTTLMPLTEGISVVCHPDPTDGYSIGKLAAKYQANYIFATATFYRLYARNKKINPLMFKDIKLAVAGAEKLPKDVKEAFKKRFNKDIYEGYGATETTPVASTNLPDLLMTDDFSVQIGNKEGSVGMAVPGSCFRIVDPETFEELPIGEDGMILIGGTQIMKGYVKDEKKTKEVIKEIDGIRWYVTGDKGHLDEDGFLTIVDRYSRFAKLGGEMVSLGLVERELSKVIDEDSLIAVTAVPDSKKGEKLVCLIEGKIEIDELKEKIKSLNLNPLFIPSSYHKVDEVPKLGSGKLDLKGLKRMALKIEEK